MSVEQSVLVRLPVDQLGLRPLLGDIRAAAARIAKALPGERTDIIRYEALSSQLEHAARRHLARPGAEHLVIRPSDRIGDSFFGPDDAAQVPSEADATRAWLAAGDVAVEIRDPFGRGQTVRGS